MQPEATGEGHTSETILRANECLQNQVPQKLETSLTTKDRRNESHVYFHMTDLRTEKFSPCDQDIEFCKQFLKCTGCSHPESKDKVSSAMHSKYRTNDCLQNHVPQTIETTLTTEDRWNHSHVLLQKTAIRTEKCSPCGQDIKFLKKFFWCTGCRVICHPECKDKVSRAMHSEYRTNDCQQSHVPQTIETTLTTEDRWHHSHVLLQKTAILTKQCSPCGQDIQFLKQFLWCTGCRVICHPECKDKVSRALHSEYKFHMLLQKTSIRTEKCTACDRDIRFCEQVFRCTGCKVICHLGCKNQVTRAMHSDYP